CVLKSVKSYPHKLVILVNWKPGKGELRLQTEGATIGLRDSMRVQPSRYCRRLLTLQGQLYFNCAQLFM
ncbi:MAG: hypothetical protein WCA35_30040, partial [Kovacikia sp.]